MVSTLIGRRRKIEAESYSNVLTLSWVSRRKLSCRTRRLNLKNNILGHIVLDDVPTDRSKKKQASKMGIDFSLVDEEARKANAVIKILDEKNTLEKWKIISELYGLDKKYSFQFWDELDEPATLHAENGWAIIKSLIAPLSDVYLFFELEDEKKAFVFESGNELADVLIETGCRDFYLLGPDMDYLLCYNDHDTILADGIAKSWLYNI